MTLPGSAPLRVAVATGPRLLAESLRVALTEARIEPSLALEPTTERFDLAVVAADGPRIDAPLLAVLDDTRSERPFATIQTAAGSPIVSVDTLEDLVALLRRLSVTRAGI